MPGVSKKNLVAVINDLRKENAEQKAEIEQLKAEIERLGTEMNGSRSPCREPGSALQMYQALQLVQRFERDAVIEQLCHVIVRSTKDKEELERLRRENQELREGKGPIEDVMLERWTRDYDISRQDAERIMSQRVHPVCEVFDIIHQLSLSILHSSVVKGDSELYELALEIYGWASAGRGGADRGN